MSDTYKVIKVGAIDVVRISHFLGKNAGFKNEIEWRYLLEWMWVNNPSVLPDTKLGWALEDISGNIFGFIGNIPVQYTVSGNIKPGIWGTSWYVADEAREMSLKMYIHFARQTEMILSNTQTQRVELVMKKLGFAEMPVEWSKQAYVFSFKIFSLLSFRNMFAGFEIKKILLGFFGIFLKIPQMVLFLLHSWKNPGKDIKLEKIDKFPDSTDQWYDEFKKEQDVSFLRTRKMYDWLFSEDATKNEFIKYQVSYQNKMQGFLIYKIRKLKGFSYIEIIDEALLSLPDSVRNRIIHKSISTLYKDVANADFLLLRSGYENSTRFLRSLFGIKYSRSEKAYIKSTVVKPDISRSTITSIDGDNLFF